MLVFRVLETIALLRGAKESAFISQNSFVIQIIPHSSIFVKPCSVICAFFGWGGLIVGILAVTFAIVSRVNLKYFDKITIIGLIL